MARLVDVEDRLDRGVEALYFEALVDGAFGLAQGHGALRTPGARDAMSKSADELRALAAEESDPLERLRVVIQEPFDSSRPDLSGTQRPLFSDFAMRLLVSHPAEMRVAHAQLLALFTELMEELEDAHLLRSGFTTKRVAALTMQTVMFNAQCSSQAGAHPLTADEIWDYCANGFTGD